MLPMQHVASVIIFGAAWVGAFVIVVWAMYYQAQATNNMKPGSPWAGKFIFNRRVPRSEFTERGLWYRRHYFIVNVILAVWAFLVIAPAFWLLAAN
jgi:hypothetical protein